MSDDMKGALWIVGMILLIASSVTTCTAHQNAANARVKTAVASSADPMRAGCAVGLQSAETCRVLLDREQ